MLGNDPPVQYAPEADPRKLFPNPSPATSVACARRPAVPTEAPFAFVAFIAWIDASRRVIDYWRCTVREQQDAMLAAWQSHLTPRPPRTDEAPSRPETPRKSAKS